MTKGRPIASLVAATLAAAALAACGGEDEPAAEATTTAPAADSTEQADLSAVKDYLLDHTEQLAGFTAAFKADAEAYYGMAEEAGFDHEALWSERADELAPLLEDLKTAWIAGNPAYERMEGVVAGTPSLAEYDVILDAGSSAAEDPESAVPFDLELADGTTLTQPGNLFNLTEGALWGTLPDDLPQSTPADLDGDGTEGFGEALPDAPFLLAAADAFDRYARRAGDVGGSVGAERIRRLHGARRDGADDERVLRPVEGIALRPRLGLRVGIVQRGLASLRHQRHPRRPRGDLRRSRGQAGGGRSSAGAADGARAHRPAGVRRGPLYARGVRASASRRSRPTYSAPRRRSVRRPSPARCPRQPPN